MNFSEALKHLKAGKKVSRAGWNGKGLHIAMQVPDKNSKMTQPYLYIDTTGLRAIGKTPPKGVVPWAPSQTDILAEDWQLVD